MRVGPRTAYTRVLAGDLSSNPGSGFQQSTCARAVGVPGGPEKVPVRPASDQ